MFLWRVTFWHLYGNVEPIHEVHSEFKVVAPDDQVARNKAAGHFKKTWRHDNGVSAPSIRRAQIEIVSEVDVL